MVKEAASFAEEDKLQKEKAEARNKAESLIYNTEKTLKDLGEKAPSDLKATVETNIVNLRTSLNGNDTATDELTRLTTELEQSTYKLSELLYQQATESEANAAGATDATGTHTEAEAPKNDDDTVIDAEFKA